MNATCPHCGKVLRVKDEWAGKALKCPQCSQTFRAGGGAISPAQAVANLGKPKAAATSAAARSAGPPARQARVEPRAGLAINAGPILLLGGAALVVLGILLVVFGPIRVKGQWDEAHAKVEEDVTTIVEFAMKAHASQAGTWNPRKGAGMPSVSEVNFQPSFLAMSLPDVVPFVGTGTIGRFEGTFTRSTREVAGTLKVGGINLAGVHIDAEGVTFGGQTSKGPAGVPMRGAANEAFQLTGRLDSNNAVSAELNGRKVGIYFPPEVDEDGNPIAPDDAADKLDAARQVGQRLR